MGSSESKKIKEEENIGAGGRFTEEKEYRLYKLVDTNSNGGELLPWMRYALNTGDYSLIDGYLDSKLKDFMYNGGKAKLESVAELVKIRNKERNAMLGAFMRKKGKGKSGPNILDDFNQEANQGDLKKALKLLDGGKSGKGDAKYREIVWKLEDRGRMGENIVGACLMQGSALHNKLAIKILTAYPKLINDIFISEEYYGLSHLHQAIVNEDPYMTHYLLQHGADINQRCYGAFFCANDQKNGRTDSLEHEYVDLPERTNYMGRTYFGEYPLAFAACTNQKDCYRLLRAKRADPNLKDTNGNTVLHMTVIHENLEMLKLAYDLGAKLQIQNNQSLTPLTLAVKTAKKKMFEQLLQLESTIDWNYGEASRVAYPLAKLDTIDQETGQLNENSALYLAAYGETEEHLEMLEGLLENLLQAKWDAFARRHWSISLFCFVVYFIFVSLAFMNRPFAQTTSVETDDAIWLIPGSIQALLDPDKVNKEKYKELAIGKPSWVTKTYTYPTESAYFYQQKRCHLTQYFNYGDQGYVRLVSESVVLFCVVFQIIMELLEIRAIGYKRWWQVLVSFEI
uniref:ANK_REP_REGION domain-containing protein n=1 Tax=Panagrolaimus sp. ES5 TaxID=591445 RepID=A0AC34FXP7_9BILA